LIQSQIINLVPSLVDLSHSVSNLVMSYYNTGFDVKNKSDDSPVTSADLASNDLIVTTLKELTPEILIVSEEDESIPVQTRLENDWIWSIDPLDGTKEFIAGNGEFSVNIALIFKGDPMLGFVILPSFNTIYYAVKNNGAFKVNSIGITKRVEILTPKSNNIVNAVTSRSHHNLITEKILNEKYGNIVWTPVGSSLKFTHLAEGKADIYLKLGKTMEWDIAAPQLILQESGGSVLSFPNLQPLKYNKEDLINPDFIAWRNHFEFAGNVDE
jgi:3'(2'), 5'-bisphosphate nucleotidase